MTISELRGVLDAAVPGETSGDKTIAAVISEVLQLSGIQATLVAEAAFAFWSDGRRITDFEFTVEGPRDEIDAANRVDTALRALGFGAMGPHWRIELEGSDEPVVVKLRGAPITDPPEVVRVGPLSLRVERREIVLAARISRFKRFRMMGYGRQAVAMLLLFRDSLDENLLRSRLRAEGAEDVLPLLRSLGPHVSEADLTGVLERSRH